MSKYKLIIFDCDGTLVDSEPVSNKVVSDMINELGIAMTPDKSILLFAGKKFADIIAYIHQFRPDINSEIFETQFRQRSKEAFEKYLHPVDGVTDVLNSLTLPYCVASNGPRIKMDTTLKVTGLHGYFNDRIYSAYDINAWKPRPDLFLHAARQMGFSPEETLVIEDTLSGLNGALNASMDCALYNHQGEMLPYMKNATYVFNHFEEINTILSRN